MQSRNKKSNYTFSYVIMGLILGFFLGSGIVYWYSNRQNDSIFANNLWDYLAGLFQGSENTSTYLISSTELPPPARPSASPQNDQTVLADVMSETNTADSLLTEGFDFEAPGAFAESNTAADSLLILEEQPAEFQDANRDADSDEENQEPSPQQPIRIAQDKLLFIRAFSLPSKKTETVQTQAMRQLDSLLGNNPQRPAPENIMLVEFWKSPLNYRGYKMSHNKLVVYGFDQMESFSLHSDGKNFFIKYFDNYYPVSLTMDFKPLISMAEPAVPEENLESWP
ncbi:MAG: hypothetical protein K0B09_13330 [Bacteroidales bacterium]|nr:hypothetical protein [Bacteroidales bacterium]